MFRVIESIVIQLGDIRVDCVFESNPVIQELEIYVSISKESHILDIGILFVEDLDWIMKRKSVSTTDIITSIRFIYTVIRPLFQRTSDNRSSSVGSRYLICLHIVCGHIRTDFKPFGKIVLNLGLQVELVKSIGLDDALFMVVIRTNVEIGGLITSGEGSICVVTDSESGNNLHPIHIR